MRIRTAEKEDYKRINSLVKNMFADAKVTDGEEQDFVCKLRLRDGYVSELELVMEEDGELAAYMILTEIEVGIEGRIEDRIEDRIESGTESWIEDRIEGRIESGTESGIEGRIEDRIESGTESGIEGRIENGIKTETGTENMKVLLAPVLCVKPDFKGQGFGGALLREGFTRAAAMGYGAVFLEGNLAYYEKFGFKEVNKLKFTNETGVPDEFVLGREIIPGCLRNVTGKIRSLR